MFLAAACGSDGSGPSETPVDLTAIVGFWTFEITDTAGCGGASFTHPTLHIHVVQDPNGPGWPSNVDLATTLSTWDSNSPSATGWLSGFLPMKVPRGALLSFTKGAPVHVVDSLRQIFQFDGRLTRQLHLAGTLIDPLPGFSPTPLFSATPCVYKAVGIHN